MFFPTIVLGTMNTILSPVVQGTERMVNKQTVQLDKLIAKRDKLQEAAYLRNPETAYLVSNEAFDQKDVYKRQLLRLRFTKGRSR